MRHIVIDPGHGGPDPGAIGPETSLRECDVALSISEMAVTLMKDELQEVDVSLTHGGLGSSLQRRCDYANEIRAMMFVSIHCNAAEARSAHGFEVFTSRGTTRADLVAASLYASISRHFPELRARTDYDDGDIDKEANFYVLRNTSMPAVLVETAFITNFSEEILLGSLRWQTRYAKAIVEGVKAIL